MAPDSGEDMKRNWAKTYEISGFGGNYENLVQRVFFTGMNFILAKDNAKEMFQGIFDWISWKYPKAFQPIMDAIQKVVPEVSGAQMLMVTKHLEFVAKHGYEKWYADQTLNRKSEDKRLFDLNTWQMVG